MCLFENKPLKLGDISAICASKANYFKVTFMLGFQDLIYKSIAIIVMIMKYIKYL